MTMLNREIIERDVPVKLMDADSKVVITCLVACFCLLNLQFTTMTDIQNTANPSATTPTVPIESNMIKYDSS